MSSKAIITATKEEATPALVPRLRFPEFRGAEEWKVIKLSSSVQLVSGMHLSPEQYGMEGAVPYFTGPSDFTNKIEAITKRTSESASLAKEDDTLITVKGSGVGETWYLTLSSVAMGRQLMAVRSIDASSGFVFQFLLTKRRRFEDLAAGNLIPGLARCDILDLEAPFPLLPEQHKIAECLSSVDELMAAQARKADALKTHKQGLMQQLFPREGETQPFLRFPEFHHDGEWVCEELSSCLKKVIDYRGIAPPKSESGVPLITAKNVRFGWLDMKNDEYIEEDKYDEWMTRGIPQAGDILFTTEAPLGNVALFPASGKFALGQRLLTLRTKPEKIVPAFLFHSLLGPTMQAEIDFHSTGSTAKGIKSKVFVKLSFCYPGAREQQRIASCLSSLDALIMAETQKHEALKTHKKGLMQQLFPSPEVVEA